MKLKLLSASAFCAFSVIFLSGCGKVSGSSVRIGVILFTTGAIAPYGTDNLKGIQLGKSRIDHDGGVFGKPVELVVHDYGGDPVQAGSYGNETEEFRVVKG